MKFFSKKSLDDVSPNEDKENVVNKKKDILQWILCIVIAIILALLVRHFIFTPTTVREVSMLPTLEDGDKLILNKWSITTGKEIERGQIITFEAPSVVDAYEVDYDEYYPVAEYYSSSNIFSNFTHYVLGIGKTSYIKRVIAIAGDHILIKNAKVYLNNNLLQEDYLSDDVYTERTGQFYDLTVPEGCVFVMGDNRTKSTDSRVFGCIPIEKIEGIVSARFWPLDKFGKVE